MIKIHARVTREIEITEKEAERLISRLCGCIENTDITEILEAFKADINSGYYEKGYIPWDWLMEDLTTQAPTEMSDYLRTNYSLRKNIDL